MVLEKIDPSDIIGATGWTAEKRLETIWKISTRWGSHFDKANRNELLNALHAIQVISMLRDDVLDSNVELIQSQMERKRWRTTVKSLPKK